MRGQVQVWVWGEAGAAEQPLRDSASFLSPESVVPQGVPGLYFKINIYSSACVQCKHLKYTTFFKNLLLALPPFYQKLERQKVT